MREQEPVTGRFSSGSDDQVIPKGDQGPEVHRRQALLDTLYGAALAALRIPHDPPTVEELVHEVYRASGFVERTAGARAEKTVVQPSGIYHSPHGDVIAKVFGRWYMAIASTREVRWEPMYITRSRAATFTWTRELTEGEKRELA